MIAEDAMAASSLSVVANTNRLRRFKPADVSDNGADLYGIFMVPTSPRHERHLWLRYPGGVSILDDRHPLRVALQCDSCSESRGLAMATAMYAVEGMTCESCMAAVLENDHSLSGVPIAAMVSRP